MAVVAREQDRPWVAPVASRRRRRSPLDVVNKTVIYALLIFGSIIFVASFAWMVTASLYDLGYIFCLPPKCIPCSPSIYNYS